MDTSLSKALIIVAGLLLAMIVIAFMTFSFKRIGTWAAASDEKTLIEQKDKFNKEYEVYDKDLMYGVDVISCLNKALSNNDKITDEKFVTGDTYDESYEVKVKLTIKSALNESITVYYMSNNKELGYSDSGPSGVKIEDAKFDFIEKNTAYFQNITNFQKNQSLKTMTSECKIKKVTEFNLTKDKNAVGESELRSLLSVSNAISETVKNKDKTNSAKENSWTKAEFKSALYDLKTRKFKCTKLDYNTETGRVNYIEFKEL